MNYIDRLEPALLRMNLAVIVHAQSCVNGLTASACDINKMSRTHVTENLVLYAVKKMLVY